MQRAQAGAVSQLWGWGRRFGEHRATTGALGGLQSSPLFIMQIIKNEQLEFSRYKKAPQVWRVWRQTPPGITTLSRQPAASLANLNREQRRGQAGGLGRLACGNRRAHLNSGGSGWGWKPERRPRPGIGSASP